LFVGVTLAILGLDPWFARSRGVDAGSPDDGADHVATRRGAATAQWFRMTRQFGARMLALATFADAMFARERERALEPRTVSRQMDDTEMLLRIRDARTEGRAWHAAAIALPASERRALVELDIDPDALCPLWQLPWGTSPQDERRCDRSSEIGRVRDDARHAARELSRIEQCLRATPPRPYR
jgi:hypothetical protein